MHSRGVEPTLTGKQGVERNGFKTFKSQGIQEPWKFENYVLTDTCEYV